MAKQASGPIGKQKVAIVAIFILAASVLIAGFASIGGPQSFVQALAASLYTIIAAGAVPVAYLAAGVGLGHLFLPLTRRAQDGASLRAALGVATMLWLSTLLGSLHVGVDPVWRVVAAAPVVAGLLLLVLVVRRRPQGAAASVTLWGVAAILPGASLLVAAALNPPGWLWGSEFGGYDALSYHLQLPQEWLAGGRVRPLEHNVYSFLPSALEAAYTHIAVLSGVQVPYSPDAPTGLLSGDGLSAISCQLLHAGLAIMSAWLVGRAARRSAIRCGAGQRQMLIAEVAAAAMFISTPWMIVTGSLAYNEMGVTLMLAGAVLAAIDEGLAPTPRGLLAGLLVGVACACKPTAFFLAGVPLGIVLLVLARPRDWALIAGAGCAAGLLALSPWLIRNALAGGNPVFPYGASIFGHAHWTSEQVARFASHHDFDGSLVERLKLAVLPDATDPAGARHRGLMHPQWMAFFPLALVGAVVALAPRLRTRVPAMLLLMLLAQIVLWLITTHIQSRFLLPLSVTGCVLFALGAARWARPDCRKLGPAAITLAACGVLAQLGASIFIFSVQRSGSPNARLLLPPAYIAGAGDLDDETIASSSILTLNRAVDENALIYLLGDAAPFYITRPAVYNTTWDRWPLGEAIEADPDDPSEWTRFLDARGVDRVLVDEVGLRLFWRSGSSDPSVTPERITAWLDDPSTRIVATWPGEGRLLVALEEPTDD
jgi:hypothetical protein